MLHPRPAGQGRGRRSDEGHLSEAVGLARAIGLDVVDAVVAPLRRPSAATLIGAGKLRTIGEEVSVEPRKVTAA